ncbi:CheR family methyltransferase, partial [Arthrospira platensis SPKY1]|nr:CheR family methyltransferase [Arthrospira platensis SPKY1]
SESIKADIPPELLKKYFVKKGDLYQVKETIRRPIIFSYHNVTNDPGFNRIDLLSCRNLLIYLNNDLQQRVLALLHYALNLHGYLFLGSSESVGDLSRYLDVVHGKSKLWQKNTLVRASNLRLKRDVN